MVDARVYMEEKDGVCGLALDLGTWDLGLGIEAGWVYCDGRNDWIECRLECIYI